MPMSQTSQVVKLLKDAPTRYDLYDLENAVNNLAEQNPADTVKGLKETIGQLTDQIEDLRKAVEDLTKVVEELPKRLP